MQYQSIYSQIKAQAQPHTQPQFPEQEQLKCPRCESINTKFCYYNNYNLSQPRHFCKNCRRYWTKGGALRNIPVGGGSRKNTKRTSNFSSSTSTAANSSNRHAKRPATASNASAAAASAPSASTSTAITETLIKPQSYGGQFENLVDFSSLLGSSGGQFTDLLNGLSPNMQERGLVGDKDPGSGHNMDLQLVLEGGNDNDADRFLHIQCGGGGVTGRGDSGCWSGGDGWPDLAIFTPGSTFHHH